MVIIPCHNMSLGLTARDQAHSLTALCPVHATCFRTEANTAPTAMPTWEPRSARRWSCTVVTTVVTTVVHVCEKRRAKELQNEVRWKCCRIQGPLHWTNRLLFLKRLQIVAPFNCCKKNEKHNMLQKTSIKYFKDFKELNSHFWSTHVNSDALGVKPQSPSVQPLLKVASVETWPPCVFQHVAAIGAWNNWKHEHQQSSEKWELPDWKGTRGQLQQLWSCPKSCDQHISDDIYQYLWTWEHWPAHLAAFTILCLKTWRHSLSTTSEAKLAWPNWSQASHRKDQRWNGDQVQLRCEEKII